MAPKDTFANRLSLALKIRDMTQQELAEKSGLGKSRISHYVCGRYEAKQDGLYQIAKALDVSEAWLMGYDCPMEREERSGKKSKAEDTASTRERLFGYFDDMTEEGQELLLRMAESLHCNYEKPPLSDMSQRASGT